MPKYILKTEKVRKFIRKRKCCICGKTAHGMISRKFYCNKCYKLNKKN